MSTGEYRESVHLKINFVNCMILLIMVTPKRGDAPRTAAKKRYPRTDKIKGAKPQAGHAYGLTHTRMALSREHLRGRDPTHHVGGSWGWPARSTIFLIRSGGSGQSPSTILQT